MTARVHIETVETIVPSPRWEGKFPRQAFVSLEQEVPPGELADVRAGVWAAFQGHRLAIDPTVAASFRVFDIRVGNISRVFFGGSRERDTGISGALFPPAPHGLTPEEREDFDVLQLLDMPLCEVSQTITVRVKNISNERKLFNAVIWGVPVLSKT